MDGRVLDAPWPVRFFIVHGLILPFRPKQSAHAYQSIWTPSGSPLVTTSMRVQALLQQRFNLPVELAMRYQNPSIASALQHLAQRSVRELLVIPLFPHYAMSSYETAAERVRELARKHHPSLHLSIQPPYYQDPDYIAALAASAKPILDSGFDHLLFSYHGVPERHIRKGDPTRSHCLQHPDCCHTPSPAHATCYRAQCFATTAAFQKITGIQNASVAFQSRLGRDPWLTPYTDAEIERLARSGVRRLCVISPAFVADCLETIEEIGMRGRDTFLTAGGTDFQLIPCLNDHPRWIDTLERMIHQFAPGTSAARATTPCRS
jgi:ferrochelatase